MATIQLEITNQSKTAFLMELLQAFQDAGWLTVNTIDGKEIATEEFNTIVHKKKLNRQKKYPNNKNG